MIKRRGIGKRAQITFTRDFHELVTGDLRPGHPVVLSYDPFRIVPAGEPYILGDPQWPVYASVQFRDGEPATIVTLESPGGMVKHPDEDVTGQGSMLQAQLMVPDTADLVIVWFSYLTRSGATVYDNDYGKNYYFGFPSLDIAVSDATVDSHGFAVRVAAAARVEAVLVRYRIVRHPKAERTEVKLEKTGQSDSQGWPIWSVTGVSLPSGSVVRFKVFYWIGGRRFKDDNSGFYYLAPQPKPEKVPPPPPGLAEAAKAWSR